MIPPWANSSPRCSTKQEMLPRTLYYLVRLRVVSRGMHDAVTMTGRRVENLNERDAVKFGCLGTLRRLQRRGLLSQEEHLCQAAARS